MRAVLIMIAFSFFMVGPVAAQPADGPGILDVLPVAKPLPDERALEVAVSESDGVRRGLGAGETVTVGVSRLDGCTFLPSLAPSEVLDELAGRALFPVEVIPDDTQRYTMIICPADGVAIPYLVNLPNWWWLDDWNPATGTAALAAPNPVSVTAILTPIESIWAVEGYDSITCTQGKPWHRDRGLRDSDPDRCGMTFPRHAPPEGLQQTVTVTYEVSFTCAPVDLCDQLPAFEPISIDTTTTIDIIQVRGVLLS